MFGQRRAGGFAVSGDDVHYAVGETSLGDQFAHTKRRKWGLLRGLEHDGASRRQGGRKLPGCHHQRKVPGDDLADHANWFAHGVGVPVARGRDLDLLPIQSRRPARHVAEHFDRAADIIAASVGDWLAVVERFQFGKFVGMAFEQVA